MSNSQVFTVDDSEVRPKWMSGPAAAPKGPTVQRDDMRPAPSEPALWMAPRSAPGAGSVFEGISDYAGVFDTMAPMRRMAEDQKKIGSEALALAGKPLGPSGNPINPNVNFWGDPLGYMGITPEQQAKAKSKGGKNGGTSVVGKALSKLNPF